jgi:putative transcriptional regulator
LSIAVSIRYILGVSGRGGVIRFRLKDLLVARGWTAYRLAQETGLTVPAAYRLASAGATLRRLDLVTLDLLCRTLDVTPGELLEYVPDKKKRRRQAPRSRS